ncbi:hypothetical protein NA57DRAFT_78131 [Rhizodiscina lignyota]|uniref:Uncharacterized protein n=1 Tax=Rhizodiscina lignyota TaxID=1504668 RepID=A0A9P4IAL8_9PEZI|nr:hypothetical protein NA57DRAFT_78131 [Rhizodiscina lignyota]
MQRASLPSRFKNETTLGSKSRGVYERRPGPAKSTPIRKYDEESGLVYQQSECKEQRSVPWTSLAYNEEETFPEANAFGSRSLYEMSLILLLRNSSSLRPDTLENVPWPIAETIWQRAIKERLTSFELWRTFCIAYQNVPDAGPVLLFRRAVRRDKYSFEQLTSGLSMNIAGTPFLVHLKIDDNCISSRDLLRLSDINCLQVLSMKMVQPSIQGMGDRVIRAWATLASEGKAFQNLRMLELIAYSSVTSQSLRYLANLPKLVLCRFVACSNSFNLYATEKSNNGEWTEALLSDDLSALPFQLSGDHRRVWLSLLEHNLTPQYLHWEIAAIVAGCPPVRSHLAVLAYIVYYSPIANAALFDGPENAISMWYRTVQANPRERQGDTPAMVDSGKHMGGQASLGRPRSHVRSSKTRNLDDMLGSFGGKTV